METPPTSPTPDTTPPLRLIPLIENGPNEKVANMLARLIGEDQRAATSALVILMGLQEFLDSGKPENVALFWEPIVAARNLKKEWGGQAYRKACEIIAQCAGPETENYRLYKDVCQILLNDPEQEKIAIDRKS